MTNALKAIHNSATIVNRPAEFQALVLVAKSAPAPRPDYPSRKLGFRYARTDHRDAYEPNAMAAVALANMRPGDTIRLGRARRYTVASISEKRLTLVDQEGKKSLCNPNSGYRWEQLVRDAGGMILAAAHGCDCGNLLNALQRDPAYRLDAEGIGYLADS